MRPNDYNDLLKKIKCTDDFRSRMQQKLTSAPAETTEYADSVSGTDVITAKHRFGRAAALAAAFVLVCGAVGGGAYHLARINNKTEESTNINTDEKASVYSRLKANKDCYSAEIRLWEDLSGDIYSKSNIDKDKIFEYLDHFDMSKGIEADDFTSTLRGIKIFFNGTDDKAKGVTYSFELFDNGELRLTEKVKSEEWVSYHSYIDGQRVFNDILYMLIDDEEAIAEFEKVTNKELENEISNGFKNNPYDKAYYYIADENRQEEYTLTGREDLAYELMDFEWERASVISGDVNQYYLGFAATEDGYLQFSSGMTYKLKNDSDLESFKNVLAKHLQPNDHWTNASEDVFDNIINEVNKSRESYNTLSGTFSMGFQGGSVNYVVDGTLKYDRVNDELYFYSEGSENGYENAVDHTVVEEAKTGGKMIMSRGSYCYESDGNSPRESKIFCDNVYDEVEEWLESRKLSENKYNIEKNTFDNGYTTYAIGSIDENKKDDIDIMNFVLDEKGRLISVNKAVLYSIGDEAHDIRMRTFYTLNEFEFDPPDFDGSDIPEKYNEMKQRLGDEFNKWS